MGCEIIIGDLRQGHSPKNQCHKKALETFRYCNLMSSYLALAFFGVFCCLSAASRTVKATLANSAALQSKVRGGIMSEVAKILRQSYLTYFSHFILFKYFSTQA